MDDGEIPIDSHAGADRPDALTLRNGAGMHARQADAPNGREPDRALALRMLNDALATEIVSWLRHEHHPRELSAIHARSVTAELLEQAAAEVAHADLLAQRVAQMGGSPTPVPGRLNGRYHAPQVGTTDLPDIIREELVAERLAIESYSELIRHLVDGVSTKRRVFVGRLASGAELAGDPSRRLDAPSLTRWRSLPPVPTSPPSVPWKYRSR